MHFCHPGLASYGLVKKTVQRRIRAVGLNELPFRVAYRHCPADILSSRSSTEEVSSRRILNGQSTRHSLRRQLCQGIGSAATLAGSPPSFMDVIEQPEIEITPPFIVGVAGGAASGKTSVCNKIAVGLKEGLLDEERFVLIAQDSFYRNLNPQEAADVASYNFDHPNAFAFDELVECVQAMKEGRAVSIPVYDYKTNSRSEDVTHIGCRPDIILFDGILAFHDKRLTSLMDLKIFVDVDSDTRLARRIRRDIVQRGRDVIQVLDQYERSVKPSHDVFIYPTRSEADIIIPRGAENQAAIDVVLQVLKAKLSARARVVS